MSPETIEMTLENVTSAVVAEKCAKLLSKSAKNANWLGVRDDFRNWLLTAA